MPPNGALAAPAEEQNFASFLDSNFYKKNINTQGKAQVVAMQDVQETKAEKVKNRAIETGEGSGENKKGMICAELEMSTLAYACSHRCFCSVCGTRESCIHGFVPTNDAKAHMPAWLGQNAHFQRTADHALERISSINNYLYICFGICDKH